jgi:hypothetical protein
VLNQVYYSALLSGWGGEPGKAGSALALAGPKLSHVSLRVRRLKCGVSRTITTETA